MKVIILSLVSLDIYPVILIVLLIYNSNFPLLNIQHNVFLSVVYLEMIYLSVILTFLPKKTPYITDV